MDPHKKRQLAAAGWRVGTPSEFLELSPVEAALVEVKVALGQLVRAVRVRAELTQGQLAERLSSSQSRVAKLEAGHGNVSLDLLVSAAMAAGASREELGAVFGDRATPQRRRRASAR